MAGQGQIDLSLGSVLGLSLSTSLSPSPGLSVCISFIAIFVYLISARQFALINVEHPSS